MKSLHRLVMVVAAVCVSSVTLANDWPQWRGPNRDDISAETGLAKQWTSAPKQVWLFKDAGKGYSGFAIANGKLYSMRAGAKGEELFALDANTGKPLWATPIGETLKNGWGDGPRGTPTVDGDKVYALGGQGSLICADAKTGKPVWKASLSQMGGKIQDWGYTESVLVDGNFVICTPGGAGGAIAALDKKTGKLAWRSKEFTDKQQYSSCVTADINKVHQIVQLTMNAIVGVEAKTGKLLWKAEWPGKVAVIPTPIVKDNFVYVTSGYGVGCKLIKIDENNTVTTVYENKVMKNHHGGVVLVGDHIYGHSDGGGWICQNFMTGEMVWNDKKMGKGAAGCVTEGMMHCLDETTGDVALVECSPKGWTEHGRFTLAPQTQIRSPKGHIWTHPVVANGKMYLRDQDLIFCFDVSGGKAAE